MNRKEFELKFPEMVVVPVEFEGYKFKVVRQNDYVYLGPRVRTKSGQWGDTYVTGYGCYAHWGTNGGYVVNAASCAYHRLMPKRCGVMGTGKNKELYNRWLDATVPRVDPEFSRPCMAWVTPKDGPVQEDLERWGFKLIHTVKSNHADYPVEFWFRKGEMEYKKKNNDKRTSTKTKSGAR